LEGRRPSKKLIFRTGAGDEAGDASAEAITRERPGAVWASLPNPHNVHRLL